MKVGPAGHEELEPARNGDVALSCLDVVIGVIRLDGVQTGIAQRRDSRVNPGTAGMRERCDAARPMKSFNDCFRRRTGSFDKGRPPLTQPGLKRVARRRHVPGRDHRARQCRPADRSSVMCAGLFEQRLYVYWQPEMIKANRHVGDPSDSHRPLRGKESIQALVFRVKEVAEHVHVPTVFDRRNLNAGNDDHRPVNGFRRRLVDAVGCVVVGHREDANSRRGGATHQCRRGQPSVRGGCMEVKIDHRRGARACRFDNALYSRIRRSR